MSGVSEEPCCLGRKELCGLRPIQTLSHASKQTPAFPFSFLSKSTTVCCHHVTTSRSRCKCQPEQPHRGSHSHRRISQQRRRSKSRDESIEDSKFTHLPRKPKFLLIDVLQAAIQGKIASIEAELAVQRAKLGEVTKGLTYVPSRAAQRNGCKLIFTVNLPSRPSSAISSSCTITMILKMWDRA